MAKHFEILHLKASRVGSGTPSVRQALRGDLADKPGRTTCFDPVCMLSIAAEIDEDNSWGLLRTVIILPLLIGDMSKDKFALAGRVGARAASAASVRNAPHPNSLGVAVRRVDIGNMEAFCWQLFGGSIMTLGTALRDNH
jgi:hypothetical protein